MATRPVGIKAGSHKTELVSSSVSARTSISIFIHSLHLLDLDRLPDWPGITLDTFSPRLAQQSLQSRCKAVEWCLYRLFEIWDRTETDNKLRPFFPCTTSLRSVNLRAAFFRLLSDLKKDGVLGKDVMLRKTMFDECKGEKFEEAIAAFAMLVLRKARVTSNIPAAAITPEGQLPSFLRQQLVPLLVAYRRSLQTLVDRRIALNENATNLSSAMSARLHDLDEKKKALRTGLTPVDVTNPSELCEILTNSWTGDKRWVDFLIYSCGDYSTGEIEDDLHDRLQNLLPGICSPGTEDDINIQPMRELRILMDQQQARIESLRSFQRQFLLQQPAQEQETNQAPPPSRPPMFEFSSHQVLRTQSPTRSAESSLDLDPQYQDLVQRIKADTNRLMPTSVIASKQEFNKPHSRLVQPSNEQENGTGKGWKDGNIHPDSSVQLLSMSNTPKSHHKSFRNEQHPLVSDNNSNSRRIDTGIPMYDSSANSRLSEDEITNYTNTLVSDLAERTKSSMAGANLLESDVPSDKILQSSTQMDITPTSEVVTRSSGPTSTQGSLLDRTRQSMSLASNFSAPGTHRSRPILSDAKNSFPINPFNQPDFNTHAPHVEDECSESFCATDLILDNTADFETVFRSRPKLRTSPTVRATSRTSDPDFTSPI